MSRRPRHDIDDSAPIDGDYTRDVVLNKDPHKAYALVSSDDLPVMLGRGFVRTERSADGARPAYDMGGDGGYEVGGQLTLMEAPAARAEAIQRRAERKFEQQTKGLRETIQQTRSNSLGSLGPDPRNPMNFSVTT